MSSSNDTHAQETNDMATNWNWDRPIASPGRMNVDFEERVNFDRLRRYRVARTRAAIASSGLGAVLCFDTNNIRYITGSVIGEWARDKICRYALFTGTSEPYLWDFGSAATHHRLFSPWLERDRCKAGMLGLRGSVAEEAGLFKQAAEEIAQLLKEEGVAGMPVGVDVCEPPMMFALQAAGIDVRDGQQVMLDARQIKSMDEIVLLNTAASMVDGTYQLIAEALKPGARENEMVALANKQLYEAGSDDVEAINAVSGERCSPHPHNFTDRMYRPGDQAFFDVIQSYMGYRTCYYRTLNVGSSTPAQEDAYRPCARVDRHRHRPREAWCDDRSNRRALAGSAGVRLRERNGGVWPSVRTWPGPGAARAANHQPSCLAGQSIRIGRKAWSLRSRPIVRPPTVTAPRASKRRSSSRLMAVKVITLFPAQELFIANKY